MNDQVLIVAPNSEIAKHYAKALKLAPREYVYVTRDSSRGIHDPIVFYVGDYWLNPHIDAIEAALEPCKPRRFRLGELG